VMGLFDGYEGGSESGSSAEMAKWLGIPAILVVDARSMARSAAALIHGFRNFDPELDLCGVIFNRVGGQAHLEYLKEAVGDNFPGLAVLGGVPREETVSIPERHLGLVTADEMGLDREWQTRLAELLERWLDLDLLLDRTRREPVTSPLSEGSLPADAGPGEISSRSGPHRATLGVARDAAFCFYYPDNLELLEAAGARLRYFSPVSGENLPDECSGLYLGGGYPEIFAEALSKNSRFMETLRDRAERGMPIYAECGGLMTLGRFIDTTDGKRFPMAGILPFGTRMLSRRKALGYTEVVLRGACLLGDRGDVMRGHEFHYSEILGETESLPGLDFACELRARKFERTRNEGFLAGSVLASYVHLHWGSAPEAPRRFVDHCAAWSVSGGSKAGGGKSSGH